MRDNPDLDAVLNDDFVPQPQAKTRKKRRNGLNVDQIRRLAFRVQNLLSGYDAPTRRRVLERAIKLNEG